MADLASRFQALANKKSLILLLPTYTGYLMSPFRNSNLLTMALGHFIVDFFSGALPIVVAAQTTPLHLAQSQVGLIALAYSMSTALAQPLFGIIADGRFATRLVLVGVLWQVVLMGASGLATSFPILLALVTLGGLGSAAFHPPGAGSVPRLSTPEKRGGAMSVFLFGGNFGYSIGPLIAGLVLNHWGAKGTVILLSGAVVLYPILVFRVLRLRVDGPTSAHHGELLDPSQRVIETSDRPVLMPIVLLGLIIVLRGWATTSITTYLPQQFLARGEDVALAGQALFLYSLAGAGGGFSAGFFSDRIGIHRMVILSLALAAPLMIAMHFASGITLLVVIALTGLFLLSTLPLTLLLGQQIFPSRPGVMTGVTLGFTFVAGGVGAAVTGLIAEHTGLATVFLWLPVLPFLGSAVAFWLYLNDRARQVAPVASVV